MSDNVTHAGTATDTREFIIPAATFRDLMAGALVAASRDTGLPSIHAVLVEWDANGVTMVATDRYRLAVGTATLSNIPGHDNVITGAGSVLVGYREAADIVKAIPKAGKRDAYVPVVTFGTVLGGDYRLAYGNALTGETWTRHIRSMDGQFPNWRTLIPTPERIANSTGVMAFTCNPDYMGDVSKLPHDDKVPVSWAFSESSRPAMGTYPVSRSGVAWQYLLMPVRLP